MITNPVARTVVVVQRFLPQYRLDFFRRVDEALKQRGGRLCLLYSRATGHQEQPSWATRIPAMSLRLKLRAMNEQAFFAPSIRRRVQQAQPGVVVLEDLGGIPTNLLAANYCLGRRIPYVVWGLGRIPQHRSSRLRSWLAPVIRRYYGRAAAFLCYSSHARDTYAPVAKPCFVALNATLARPTDAEFAQTRQAIARRSGTAPLRIVTLGQLIPRKRQEVLLRALAGLTDLDFELHVIGDGPTASELREIARAAGIGDRVRFHGAVYDHARKAEILQPCQLGVLPGRGGLAIQELMWHGVPVISGAADGTERDLIAEDRGFLLDGLPTESELAAAIRAFGRTRPEQRESMARASVEIVREAANLEAMVAAWVSAVETYLDSADDGVAGH